ncbi:MAG: GPW/gp25 family protein [Holosporales bacterium]|jgi:predicted component of type VI protein secretion system|nr:GPW/gp25 family protein [Holosporales bacterium]
MTDKIKLDHSFLSKFNNNQIYINSTDELYKSIMKEIENILSSRLKLSNSYKTDYPKMNSPFSYGVRDLQSIESSQETFEDFKIHCQNTILAFEPRLKNITISDIKINKDILMLFIKITIFLKDTKRVFTTEIMIN